MESIWIMKHLILLIDSLGYSAITQKRTPKLLEFFKKGNYKSTKTLLGYSSAIIPSIFSGKYPSEHDVWAVYKKSPDTSPFKISPLLPKSFIDKNMLVRYVFNRKIFSDSIKNNLIPDNISLVNVPLKLLKYFDISMKKHIFDPGSLNSITTLFDLIRKNNLSFKYVGYPDITNSEKIFSLTEKHLKENSIVFAYIDELDHNGHVFGLDSSDFLSRLEKFDDLCTNFLKRVENSTEDVSITTLSDHGMKNIDGTVDIKKAIESTSLRIEKDYIPYYDSTIARFWVFNNNARNLITDVLQNSNGGHLLSQEEIRNYKLDFKSNSYGDLYYLADVGKLIFPNFFTVLKNRMPKAMHGWEPTHDSQLGFLYTNQDVNNFNRIDDVTKIFNLFREIMNI